VKIKAEADRALDDAKSKAVCIQKRAQAALALAESIAKGRRLIALSALPDRRLDQMISMQSMAVSALKWIPLM
jgi:hypothetical protein